MSGGLLDCGGREPGCQRGACAGHTQAEMAARGGPDPYPEYGHLAGPRGSAAVIPLSNELQQYLAGGGKVPQLAKVPATQPGQPPQPVTLGALRTRDKVQAAAQAASPSTVGPWVVVMVGMDIRDGVHAWGPFTDEGDASEFAGFLAQEVDPCLVVSLGSPTAELLAWRAMILAPDQQVPTTDPGEGTP